MAAHESTGFTVSFATVEKTLLKMHNVKPQHEDACRARINFLRREGLLGERPGSGRRIGYHTADTFRNCCWRSIGKARSAKVRWR
jgi:hypothetical protein